MRVKYTHKVVYIGGGVFFAKIDVKGRRMYVSEVTRPDGAITYEADSWVCREATVEEYFSTPIGSWQCTKLNTFKGNK